VIEKFWKHLRIQRPKIHQLTDIFPHGIKSLLTTVIKIMMKPCTVGKEECLCWCSCFQINESFITSFSVSNHETWSIQKYK